MGGCVDGWGGWMGGWVDGWGEVCPHSPKSQKTKGEWGGSMGEWGEGVWLPPTLQKAREDQIVSIVLE